VTASGHLDSYRCVAPALGLSTVIFKRIYARQACERVAYFTADQRRWLRNDIGDLPI
jgi:hypothetical protein